MSARKRIQIALIRQLAASGQTSIQIQRQLSSEGFGMRRSELLKQIREAKGTPARVEATKYTPRKYQIPREFRFRGSHLAVYTTTEGEGRRVQMYGSGKDLYAAMVSGVAFHPPRKKFLTASAREIADDPEEYLDLSKEWDQHPEAES